MGQEIRIGTYNTNNLFDRFDDPYNFSDDPWRRAFAAKPKKLSELYLHFALVLAFYETGQTLTVLLFVVVTQLTKPCISRESSLMLKLL